ncbi:hypothetical protein DYB30_010817 [Aphanomyces astaci]|uniref:Uncharacterized protein n=1 Tax=Aphanomyces astaci TaxID=112090 RepID=A0A397CNH2_APHAT|nr:hypothetical protein DYB30_010817 [Aphanomyces astaci]
MELEIPLVNIVIHTCCALHNFVLACGADLGADDSVDDTAGAADIAHELEELTERFESHDSGEWRDVLANDM